MIHRASNEHTIGELGNLYGQNGDKMAFVTDSPIKSEEVLNNIRHIRRRENISDEDGLCDGVDEVDAGVVADDVDVSVLVGLEAAGEGREVRQGGGEAVFEEREEGGGGEGRAGEEAAFLDVVAGEHWEVGNGEFEVVHGGFLGRGDGGFGDHCHCGCRGRR